MKRRRHEDRMWAALAHDADSRRLDRARDYWDARNASSLDERRVGGVPVDSDDVPDREDV